MGVPTGAVDPHLGVGGARRSFLEAEIVSGLVEHLPLEPARVRVFLDRAVAYRRTESAEGPPLAERDGLLMSLISTPSVRRR